MRPDGGVRFDPSIRSTYTPRASLRAVARQFYRYGRSRAATIRRHPASIAPRQLVAPFLLVSLVTPWRRWVALAYGTLLLLVGARQLAKRPLSAAGLTVALPAMHLPWAVGFIQGLFRRTYELSPVPARRPAAEAEEPGATVG